MVKQKQEDLASEWMGTDQFPASMTAGALVALPQMFGRKPLYSLGNRRKRPVNLLTFTHRRRTRQLLKRFAE